MKSQLNVRLSTSGQNKLDWLTRQYGTRTAAIEVAIDRLYTAEKKERKMYRYSVTINPSTDTDQSILNFLAELEPDVAAAFVDTDADDCQIWHMTTDRKDLDAVLDANPLVVGYEVSDSDSPQYAAYHDKAD